MQAVEARHRLGDLAIRKGWVRPTHLDRLLKAQESPRGGAGRRRIGELLLSYDLVSAEQLRTLLRLQRLLREGPSGA